MALDKKVLTEEEKSFLYNRLFKLQSKLSKYAGIDDVEKYTLRDIDNIDDAYTARLMAEIYRINLLITENDYQGIYNYLYPNLEGQSIEVIEEILQAFKQENTSEVLWPGDVVVVYPRIKWQHNRKPMRCHICGAGIMPDNLVGRYRPLLWNMTKKETFYLVNSIIVREDCKHELPDSILMIEEIQRRIDHSYELYNYDYADGVDYEEFSANTGGGFRFSKLTKKRP